MGSVEEKMKVGSLVNGVQRNLMEEMKLLKEIQDHSGSRKNISSELWYACAGPLVSLPQVGSLVYYFPQGHSEQVAVSTRRTATSQIPNYPNLPSQLLCQIHNVTLHADKDTDEIYAQMSLQPVNSEKDVFPIPDFGIKSKHPSEFFCKTLTASDTSTHGGFSVPRRAAEKLFPPLDYSIQPPTQELVVRDLHENTWTFRHIYRGQPKRHLLTTGWSLFVGSKRLKAGDSVLFIRDEKSQLMVGVRRANRQQTTLPSSVLSADSMHIGVLAAAAHAAANRSPFTIFYNPRACPSEFVIPLTKFRKAVYDTQVSVGMRFGMMFETEESGKRRYMGTIVGLSDLDPLRWPGSKWRNLQVEWDEPGCSDKQNRVSSWEIETPESLFIFPSLTSGLKRPIHSGFLGGETEWGNMVKRPLIWYPENSSFPYPSIPNLTSDRLLKMFMKPQVPNYSNICESALNEFTAKVATPLDDGKSVPVPHPSQPVVEPVENQTHSQFCPNPPDSNVISIEKSKSEPENSAEQSSKVTPTGDCNEKSLSGFPHLQNPGNEVKFQNSSQGQNSLWPLLDSPADMNALNSLPFLDTEEWISNPSCLPLPGIYGSPMFGLPEPQAILSEPMNPTLPIMNQDVWDQQLNQLVPIKEPSGGGKDVSGESGIYIDPNAILDDFRVSKDASAFNFGSSQDVQSQVSLAFSEFPDSSGGTSSSNVDFEKTRYVNGGSWQQQVAPRVRTYTKVQKAGSVGRSIDVSSFKNYEELCSAIECMFGLDGLLNNPRESGWKLVYVDYEDDVLLIGDDPWEEFVGCVRCIRILSPTEVQQMSEEGMKLLNNANIQGLTGP